MIWLAVAESRSPVGSSAHTIAGSLTRARDGDALALTSGELAGTVFRPLDQADPLEAGERDRARLARRGPETSNGSSTFSTALRTGSRL